MIFFGLFIIFVIILIEIQIFPPKLVHGKILIT